MLNYKSQIEFPVYFNSFFPLEKGWLPSPSLSSRFLIFYIILECLCSAISYSLIPESERLPDRKA